MKNRLSLTLLDAMAVVLNPALIMLLVGSLVFFLVEVFYQGQYQTRLLFIFAFFVLAIVLIGRLSITNGAAYASMFGAPLAFLTGIAMIRFVQITGPLAAVGPLINWGLLALIWWAANKLTWDCTLIDDDQDVSGQGLLQTAGLDIGQEGEQESHDEAETSQSSIAPSLPDAPAAVEPISISSWWKRLVQRRKRANTPGLWVVYFSLAALPLFGLGQMFLRSDTLDSRRYTFLLLCVYVASGMALLMTTSLLSLRRYLRQRQVEMPLGVASAWLMAGCSLILAVMFVAWLLPRRSPEYSITQIPIHFSSPERKKTTPYAPGNDGPRDDQKGTRTGDQTDPDATEQGDGDNNPDSPKDPQSDSSEGDSEENGEQSGSNGENSSSSADGGTSESDSEGEGPSSDSQNEDAEQSGEDSQNEDQEAPGGGSGKGQASSSGSDQTGSDSDQSDSQQGSSSSSAQNQDEQDQSRQSAERIKESIATGMLLLIKWLFYLGLLLLAGYFAWRYRAEIREAWRRLVAELRDLWQRLFGQRQVEEVSESLQADAEPPPRPFSDFADPFASGQASQLSVEELVRYSFEAFEAWARERQCPRSPEQTPREFATQVGSVQKSIKRDAHSLALLYSQAAYSRNTLPSESVAHLRKFWRQLGSSPPV